MELILWPVIVFAVFNISLLLSLFFFFAEQSVHGSPLNISVIIAARNESSNITSVIECLRLQEYPAENFEVIIIDDYSDDNTLKKTSESIAGLRNFRVLKAMDKKYEGKKGALDVGISRAKYPFIMITDADCLPGPGWVSSFSSKFSEGFDFVFGPAPFKQTGTLVNCIACFENLRNSILMFAAVSFKFPYSAAARSFGFKKSSFQELGGYENTLETLGGDDDLLLREAIKSKMKIGAISSKDAFVYSRTKENIHEYAAQKSRHVKTSVKYTFSRKVFLATWHILNLLFLLPLIFMDSPALLALPAVKLVSDFVVVKIFQEKFSYRFNAVQIIYLQVIYEFLVVYNFLNALIKEDKWK